MIEKMMYELTRLERGTNMRKYEVIEDNGGGLHLAVYDESGESVVYLHSGYEYITGQLTKDLVELKNGAEPEKEWDGNCGGLDLEFGEDPQALYDNITSYEYGWEIVADNDGIYPNKMGGAACLEFGIDRD